MAAAEEQMQQLRSKATELLLREEWEQSIQLYSQLITLCKDQIFNIHRQSQTNPDADHLSKLHRSLCLAFSNRAEARSRLQHFIEALNDCEQALQIDATHFKTLLCRGKILLSLNRYSHALNCFQSAVLYPQSNENLKILNGYLEKCKKLELQSRIGSFDLSDWVLQGFQGNPPELAEYIGPVMVKRSELSGRGLFATKNIDVGSFVLVTKAVAIERCILGEEGCGENAQLVMWRNFIDKVREAIAKCKRTEFLISMLSPGENEEDLQVPDMSVFRPEMGENGSCCSLDMEKVLNILDVNSLMEEAVSAKVLRKNTNLHGVGLWILASFINHSCNPNARRLHVGDYVMVHASRDIKAGEEITFMYFDALSPLDKRVEMSKSWGFVCKCRRCKLEECKQDELREIEIGVENGLDVGAAVYKLEEGMRRWAMRGKEKDYLRASFWAAYSEVHASDRSMKRWGRRIPVMEAVVDSVVEAVGVDERVLKVVVERLKKKKSSGDDGGVVEFEFEKGMKLGRGLYGRVAKKQAMRILLELA